jgi:hypothetical protein
MKLIPPLDRGRPFWAGHGLRCRPDPAHRRHIRFVVSTALGPERQQLDRYGISAALGPNAYYDTPGEALEAFHAAEGVIDE